MAIKICTTPFEKLKPPTGLLDGMKGYEPKFMKYRLPRVCIREEFEEIIHILKGCTPSGNKANNVKKWTFHYNDGTVETVILRGTN